MSEKLPSDSLISHYRIVSKLGEGGMGEVWLAEDTRLGRKVALKLLPSEFTEDSDRVRRFTQEAKAASALNHPNIIGVYDIGECETGRFIVMEFVDGKTLRHTIANDNSLETFFNLSGQMAKALSAAHSAGITHRDIKPDNIMVRGDGYLKMLDFGLARLLPNTASDPEAATLAQQTTPGTVMGTLAYMSPEQASGQTVGSASDVFALGIVLYELITGSHPFKSETMIGYLHAITSQTPEAITKRKSNLPEALDDVILRMLDKDPMARPSASDVATALQEIEKYGTFKTLPLRAPKTVETRGTEGFWVAVLPFKFRGTNSDLAALADGLTEDIITGLSRFSYLQVVARSSTSRFTNDSEDVVSIGNKLGARYVMEGSLRQAGSLLRVSVQLVDARSGANLWAQTYDRPFTAEEIFAVQDDLVPRIVSTVADWYGVLPHSMSEVLRLKSPEQLTPYEALLRSFGYYERITPDEHLAVRTALERAVEGEPLNADVNAMLSMLYGEEHRFGFNVEPDSLGRSLNAARRAVDAGHGNHFAWVALAQALYFRKELDAFRDAANRAVSLNPMDGSTLQYMAHLIAFAGDWDRGCAIAERSRELNPNHPAWYWAVPCLYAYRNGDYEGAKNALLKGNQHGHYLVLALLAAIYGQLGDRQSADEMRRKLLGLNPDAAAVVRKEFDKWYSAELVDQLMEGLRKAGFEIAERGSSFKTSSSSLKSSEFRADEGFWVAVVPFKFTGSNVEVTTLADGLSEEIVNGLSRFSYLRVISRSSTLRYANETSDVRAVGETLGARYVLEGTLRIAGTSLRVSVQLVDATTGAHLWAETYKRSLNVEDLFELQDDLASRIVATIADMNGILPHTLGELLRQQDPTKLTPYESVLRAFAFVERLTAEEHLIVRSALERAVEQAPGNSDCLAMLAMLYVGEYIHAFNPQPNPLDRALAMSQRAVAAGPSNHIAQAALAQTLYFRRDLHGFRSSAERAIALNPMDAYTKGFMGILIAYSGDWEYGSALVEKGMELNPNHPGWYRFLAFFNEYAKRDYQKALDIALKINMPSYYFTPAAVAMTYGQLGELAKAQTALRELLAQVPVFGDVAREMYEKWFGPGELLELVLNGLSKAGLEIRDARESFVPSTVSNQTRADEGFWIAVLPFKFTGSNVEVTTLAEGMSEEIVNGLSRFSYLRVIARGSTLGYTTSNKDLRTIGKELGAGYIMEGSFRLAGTLLRISVQLVDAQTGAHLWAETYDRSFNPDSIFQLQDELVPKIVATAGDRHGVLPHTMSEALRNRNVDELRPYEVLLRGFGYFERVNPTEHAALRGALEHVVEQHASSDSWAMLALLYCDEHRFGFNPLPNSLERALAAAQRAVEASVSNSFAYEALAQSFFFRREFDSFRKAAERAIALNPFDGATTALMGLLIAYTGDWEYGCALAERATKLNPHHPGWYWNAAFYNAYRKGDYEAALKITLEFNMPGLFYHHVNRAAVYGQLGDHEAASKAVSDLLRLKPDFESTARMELGKWLPPDLLDHLIQGLRKAGLAIDDEATGRTITEPPLHHLSSGESRADEGFWVAVLPFKFTGTNPEVATLAEGLSEEIITGLSRFSYLRVISRSSTLRYASETDDVRTVGKTLGARYVMEGSLRVAGPSLRISVQLIDANTGAHLWAETYDRQFRPEDVFALQDDLVPRIVSTVADVNGVLPRGMCEVVCSKKPQELSPYEAVLRGFRYFDLVTADELEAARISLEVAVEKAPTNSDAWAMLALLHVQDYGQGFNLNPDALNLGTLAAQRAVETGPANHLAYFSLAQARFFQKDLQSFHNAAERAVALNPMDANSVAFMGELLTYVGDSERGLALATRAKEINPNHPGWFWYANFFHAYRQGDYREALALVLKANLPGHWGMHAGIAATAGQLGDKELAAKALRDLLKLRPNYGVTVHETLAKWFDPELCEQLIDGLRKAGLEIKEAETGRSGEGTTDAVSPLHSVIPSPRLPVPPSPVHSPAIVVLPFANRSPVPDNDYFSDGLTEEIITDLSQIKALRVISRNSSMSFKGTTRDTPAIARELGVSHVVSGSVRRAGDELRVTVELIEVVGDTSLWSEKYSGKVADVFAIQEEIALKIVSALKVKLTAEEEQKTTSRPIDDVVAYDCYLRARQEMYGWTPESMDRADKLVDQALGIVGENSLLLATKGQIYWNKVNVLIDPGLRNLDIAEDCARRALALDENDYLGLFLRGIVSGLKGDSASALRDIYRAHQLRPGDPNVLTELCRFSNTAGVDVDDYVKKLVAVDPLTAVTWCVVQYNHVMNGRLEEAAPAARRVVELAYGPSLAHIFAASSLTIAGRRDEALELLEMAGAHLSGTLHGSWALSFKYALAGDAETARAEMSPLLKCEAGLSDLACWGIATNYSLIGDTDESLNWIEKGMNRGFINYPFLASYDPLLTNARKNPRFAELMEVVKTRWKNLAHNLPGSLRIQTEPVSDKLQFVADEHLNSVGSVSERNDKLKFVAHSPSIAVLPFVNISNDADNEYFCDGLAEELLTALSKIESLHVAARTSAFSFKGKGTDVREIGSKLNVATVLEGSVRKSGSRVRISVQLVNVEDGYHLWSEKYDRELKDIFDIQDEISLAIVDALKVKLLGSEQKVVKRYTDNTEAYQLYLKGRFFVNKRTSQSLLKAIDYFNEAIALDANYALGYAGLADAYMVLGVPDAVTEALSPTESLTKARAAAEKALAIDSSVAEVYAALAHIKWKSRDWVGAENDYLRSIELNPSNPIAHFYYAVCLSGLGRREEAVKEIRYAQELDPLSLPVNASVVYVLYLCRRYDEAIAAGKKTLDLDSTFPLTHQRLGLPYVQKKMYSEAIAEFERATIKSNRAPQSLVSLAHAYAVAGNKDESQKILVELKALSSDRYVSPYGIATIYVGLNEKEQAFAWLQKAFDEGNTELTFLKVDPRMDPLRNDPRYSGLLKRVGFNG